MSYYGTPKAERAKPDYEFGRRGGEDSDRKGLRPWPRHAPHDGMLR